MDALATSRAFLFFFLLLVDSHIRFRGVLVRMKLQTSDDVLCNGFERFVHVRVGLRGSFEELDFVAVRQRLALCRCYFLYKQYINIIIIIIISKAKQYK